MATKQQQKNFPINTSNMKEKTERVTIKITVIDEIRGGHVRISLHRVMDLTTQMFHISGLDIVSLEHCIKCFVHCPLTTLRSWVLS